MSWVDVIEFERMPVDRGVAAIVDGQQVALFRLSDGSVYAIDHIEPFTGMPVLARGLVGSNDAIPTVASPLHKQRFDLRSGRCLDAEEQVATYPVEIVDGIVRVAASTPATATLTPLPHQKATTMTPDQIELVRTSFSAVEPIADDAAALFYGRLFEIAPETEALFSGDMAEQGKKLMTTLGVVVKKLDDLDDLLPTVNKLAERHVGYGVTAGHYDAVGAALLWTLGQGLGDAFTPDTEAAWTTAYTLLAGAMIAAADAVTSDPDGSQLAS